MELADAMRMDAMRILSLVWLFFAWGGGVMNAQQVLLVNPGGIVVAGKNCELSMVDKNLSKDEMTFEHGGRTYLNGGQAYFEMLEKNVIKYSVLDKLTIKNKILYFEEKPIDIGISIYRIGKALRWGELVACIGTVPNKPRHWLEPKKAYALIVFSPTSGKGSFKPLYLDAGKASCDIWLLEPIESKR